MFRNFWFVGYPEDWGAFKSSTDAFIAKSLIGR